MKAKLPLLALPLLLAGCSCPWTQSDTKAYPQNQSIQKIVDDQAKSTKETLHPKGLCIVVAEPKSGKILAMSGNASGVMYEPGSTFKPVVAIAALQEGAVTPKSKINCENGSFTFAGKTIKDHYPSSELTYDEILMRSSNIGATKMAMLLKDPVYYDYVRRFGFGEKTGIAIPGEIQGIVNPPSKWDPLTKARMSFGQSVAVTPIQLAMAYCTIANGGLLMKPVIGNEKPVVVRQVCSSRSANLVKNALKNTVTDQGTAPLARVDGVSVGGKTGTAQAIAPSGGYYADKYITSFAGFFPVEKPRYVVVVVVDQADLPPEKNYGGLVAAPIFSSIASQISKLPSK
jgi:cell division protein FtsI/penicillin-binding protein 2